MAGGECNVGEPCITSTSSSVYKAYVFFVRFWSPGLPLVVFLCPVFFHFSSGDSSSGQKGGRILIEGCDLFSGEWIPDTSGPAYTNASCSYISNDQNCMRNGRPDTGYLYWRWKPHDCESPSLNPGKFLDAMRDKSLVFVGDSILRNQMESLLCLLSKNEEPQLVYVDAKYQSKTWYLPLHNITLGLIWAPFLVNSTENHSSSDLQIWLDALDMTWASQYHKYDYVFLSGGQWFMKKTIFWENNTIIGCHYCPGMNLNELGMDYSYRKALQLALQFMAASDHKPLVVLRTWSPDHFEHGKWYSAGICNRTQPFKEGEYIVNPMNTIMRGVELEEFEKGLQSGLHIKLLDTYYLSLLRPDGHPGPYRRFHPDISKMPQNDCLHWCLPGPIDTWNYLLADVLLNEARLRGSSDPHLNMDFISQM